MMSAIDSHHRPRVHRATQLALSLVCSAALSACAVGPDFRAPHSDLGNAYVHGDVPLTTAAAGGPAGEPQRFIQGGSPGEAWWQAFGSDELDRLVQLALAGSPTLEQAQHRLRQAQADFGAQGGIQWPQVTGTVNATRQQQAPAGVGVPTSSPFTVLQANVSVSYTLDLFGADRRALEGVAAQVDYQRFQLEAARATLAANVATTALRHASLAAQIDLTQRLLGAQERQLEIAEKRMLAGSLSELDMLSQRSQVEQTRAGLEPLRTQLAQAEHQLAVYLGQAPSEGAGDLPSLDRLRLPQELPLAVPSELARQRPDFRASEALLHQASANVGVATANLYPQITLTGSYGGSGAKLSDLSSVWTLGAGLTQPLFNGGQLRARQRSAQEAYEVALASHRQTVLQGLQQVADTLRALEHDASELAARDAAQRDSAAAAQLARRRYEVGGLSQLALLDAQRQELQTALDRSRVQAQRLIDTATLYQALGAKP
ncbi:MAG TPA: efflux transporter outer membrane subunit [Burkholderiales bacterium]|nr:efflux transporter outer membrane subunit [Burkholderiales bacterium]